MNNHPFWGFIEEMARQNPASSDAQQQQGQSQSGTESAAAAGASPWPGMYTPWGFPFGGYNNQGFPFRGHNSEESWHHGPPHHGRHDGPHHGPRGRHGPPPPPPPPGEPHGHPDDHRGRHPPPPPGPHHRHGDHQGPPRPPPNHDEENLPTVEHDDNPIESPSRTATPPTPPESVPEHTGGRPHDGPHQHRGRPHGPEHHDHPHEGGPRHPHGHRHHPHPRCGGRGRRGGFPFARGPHDRAFPFPSSNADGTPDLSFVTDFIRPFLDPATYRSMASAFETATTAARNASDGHQQQDGGDTEGVHEPETDVFFDPARGWTIFVSLPGAKKGDVDVSFDTATTTTTAGSVVRISAVVGRPEEVDEGMLETMVSGRRRVGLFRTSVRLEGDGEGGRRVDHEGMVAKLEEGVLRVEVPVILEDEWTEVRKVVVE